MQRTTLNTVLTLIALATGLSAQANPQRQPLARMGDQAIYEEDLLPSIGGQLFQLKNQEYELRMRALQNLVNQRLLEKEAQGTGLSIQQFLTEKVDGPVASPTAGEIEAYYLAHKDPLSRPLNEIKPQLEQTARQLKVQQARNEYFDKLQQKASVSILFNRPRAEVDRDPSRTRGNLDAPVTIVEFADFECPYCQAAEEALRQVIDKYQGKVSLAFLDFPLRQIHPLAQQAAEASRCAGEQDRFWEYHDMLLGKDARLDPDGLREHARKAGLNAEEFGACLQSRKFVAPIESDLLTGYRAGVSGTPTFYINGIALVGIQPASAFEKIIDSELAVAGSKKSAQ